MIARLRSALLARGLDVERAERLERTAALILAELQAVESFTARSGAGRDVVDWLLDELGVDDMNGCPLCQR